MEQNCDEMSFWRYVFQCKTKDAPSISTSDDNLGAALAGATTTLTVQVVLFMCLRTLYTGIYSPKSHLVSERERVPSPPAGVTGWLIPLWTTSSSTIIEKCGLDAFFFLRYLRLQLKIFIPAATIILPILLPINTTSSGEEANPQKGLNRQSFSNVDHAHAHRLWAHLLCAIVFISWVCYCIFMELKSYIRIRQIYQTSPQHRMRASATTVLVSGIPAKWCNLAALNGLFDTLPGGVHTIWVNRDFSELGRKIKHRDKIAKSLEDAVTMLIRQCYKANRKISQQVPMDNAQQQPVGGISTGAHKEITHGSEDILPPRSPQTPAGNLGFEGASDGRPLTDPAGVHDRPQLRMEKALFWDDPYPLPSPQPHVEETDEFPLYTTKDQKKQDYPVAFDHDCDEDQDNKAEWRRYLTPADRQTIRLPIVSWLPSLPSVGLRVDRIYYLRRELARLNLEIETDQSRTDRYPLMNSAFVQFNDQAAAHLCCQSLCLHIPAAMTPRIVEISPNDILWENLSMSWWERELRTGITFISCLALIVLYAIPVAFTGLLSNIGTLAKRLTWLEGLNRVTGPIRSAIQSLLPQLILIVLLLLIPVIFRALIHQQGVPTGSSRERGVQKWFFAFLFVQMFLVVTLSTGLVPFIMELSGDNFNVARSLARSVPPAANFFFTYLTVQALNNSATNLLNPAGLLSWLVLAPLNDSTAHEKWKRQTEPNTITWGSFFPLFTNFAAVGLVYSILAPLILVFMMLIFGLFSIVYRYNILFVYRSINDTGGLLFPVALKQMFTGLYILELCLIGLFLAVEYLKCLPQAIIMMLALIGTAFYQWHLNEMFDPLSKYLPISLEENARIREEQWAKANGERHRHAEADSLYASFADELEDLTPEERQAAVRGAFQPEALRATRPVIWIPRDPLGIGDDEIRRAGRMSKHIWMSNEGASLDEKGRVVFSAPPPDFSSKDLIVL